MRSGPPDNPSKLTDFVQPRSCDRFPPSASFTCQAWLLESGHFAVQVRRVAPAPGGWRIDGLSAAGLVRRPTAPNRPFPHNPRTRPMTSVVATSSAKDVSVTRSITTTAQFSVEPKTAHLARAMPRNCLGCCRRAPHFVSWPDPRKTRRSFLLHPFTAHRRWLNYRSMFGQTKRTMKTTKPCQRVVRVCAC